MTDGRSSNYEASKMVMTLKGRSPKGGGHRKNSAVLEALFEMIERSAGLKLVVSFCASGGLAAHGLMALSPDGALPRSPF